MPKSPILPPLLPKTETEPQSPRKHVRFDKLVSSKKTDDKSDEELFPSDLVERTPSLPASRFRRVKSAFASADDLKLKKSKNSLSLVHKVFSKTEEESPSAEMLSTLNRLPSYSFFPTNKEKTYRPARRLNRELTDSRNSFTEKLVNVKVKNRSPPVVRFKSQLAEEPPKETGRGKRPSFLQFMKRK